MSSGYLSQIETGARKDPGFKTVLLLAKSIGVSMDDLARQLEGFAITTKPPQSGHRSGPWPALTTPAPMRCELQGGLRMRFHRYRQLRRSEVHQ
jgi:transcriptional regulator with XRE-family HTH domain